MESDTDLTLTPVPDAVFDPTEMHVTASRWGVSCEHTSFERPYAECHLRVFYIDDEPNEWGGVGNVIYHPEHHGKVFASHDESRQYAMEAGLLKVFVSRAA